MAKVQARLTARAPRRPAGRRSTSTPAARRVSAPPAGDGVGVGLGVDDAGDPGVDQRLRAGTGAAGVVAGLEGDVRRCRRGRRSPARGQRVDLGVRGPGAAVAALADDRAVAVER